ncbi:MAG TPA: hypothetical protein VN881_00550 [Candidatus Acidoferrales bacterium]|nr:hypothetical protein [Candidatus Acidoferrales bacterium]
MDFKLKTHFEQVPLEIVKKIAKIEPRAAALPPKQHTQLKDKAGKALGATSMDALQAMNSSFDIFQLELDGSVLWQGLAADIEEAKRRVKELQLSVPAQYMVVSLKTGSRLFIDFDGVSGQQTPPARPGVSQQA